MARYAVVLDACVLVPVALVDTLLRIAERDLYRPLWSDRIFAEATDAIVEIHPDIPPEQIARRFASMDVAARIRRETPSTTGRMVRAGANEPTDSTDAQTRAKIQTFACTNTLR